MNESETLTGPGPYSFVLTDEEARIAASRAGLRMTLAGRLSFNHIAPLVAFALFVFFVAILTVTGLLSRRLGEAGLLLAAIAFMASRMAAHWRLRGAQKNSLAATDAIQKAGQAEIWLDDAGLRFENASGSRCLAFAECDEAEHVGGMIYLWPRKGEPAFIPAHALGTTQAAQEFLVFVRDRIRSAGRPKPA